jgi:protein-tyrosine phosphatase
VIDLHTHILWGLDDGARSVDESLDMARAALEDGIDALSATPHVRDDFPTTPAEMEARLAELRAALEDAGIALELLPGGELALDRLLRLEGEELRRFGLAGNPHVLLLEFPYTGWPIGLADQLFSLSRGGTTPVLAHPERNPEVQRDPEKLRPLVDAGALVQVTAASVEGRLGKKPKAAGLALVQLGLAHMLASDAHAPDVRAIGLSAAARAVGGGALAEWLTEGVPRAIVSGSALPARPAAAS